MDERYKRLPPGLERRMEYSRMLRNRNSPQTRIYMSYEELSLLTPVYLGVNTFDYLLNTSVSLGVQGDFCAICQECVKPFSLSRILKCNHKFHNKCLGDYCKFYNKCPLCRTEII